MPLMTFASRPVRGSHHSSREESGEAREQTSAHTSVMVQEVLRLLAPRDGEAVLDATYGLGGHSRALERAARVRLVAIDADPRLPAQAGESRVIVGNFASLDAILKKLGITKIDKALFDLGWNRAQLEAGKGFSFLVDEPLNMSYGAAPLSGFTARDIVNTWSEKALADVFYGYGEERYARRIANAVIERRKIQPIETTIELVEIIKDAVPPSYRHGRLHPATRSFQALRIAVNDELRAIERGVSAAWKHLSPCGRIVVITFHSIEDRAVKRLFASLVKKGGVLLVKKPLVPSREEIIRNPSARSAKLRAIEKPCKKD